MDEIKTIYYCGTCKKLMESPAVSIIDGCGWYFFCSEDCAKEFENKAEPEIKKTRRPRKKKNG